MRPTGQASNWITLHGYHGEFQAPGCISPISYLLTHASLASEGSGGSLLTRHLVPVRELFDLGALNFNELVQRDLDDHRVATELIPYILQNTNAVRFFPPILAVVVPMRDQRVIDNFPDATRLSPAEDQSMLGHATGLMREQIQYGQVLAVERYCHPDKTYDRTAAVRFNPEQASILVIDGQHRAMALLAIKRIRAAQWGDRGADYRSFYEDLTDQVNAVPSDMLAQIEIPVCLAFLAQADGASRATSTTVQAARKLFLDVNRTARRPTRARQLLLDDTGVISILTRHLLSHVRTSASKLDITCFEYDSPRESPRPQRDLAFATIEMVYEIVWWTLFSADKYFINAGSVPHSAGSPRWNTTRFLNELQADSSIKSATLAAWGLKTLDAFDPDATPLAAHQALADLFMKGWGTVITDCFVTLHPYQSHANAVEHLRGQHQVETGFAALARRALFDGQGVYWTMRSYAEHRRQQRLDNGNVDKTQVEKAYEVISNIWIPKEFEVQRAKEYWGKKSVSEPEQLICNRAFAVYRTMAFQVGVFMAMGFLKRQLAITDPATFVNEAKAWVACMNRALTATSRSRQMFDPKSKGIMSVHPGRLQKSDWVWFRLFTMELLHAGGNSLSHQAKAAIEGYLQQARPAYVRQMARGLQRAARKKDTKLKWEKAVKQAATLYMKVLQQDLDTAPDADLESRALASPENLSDQPDNLVEESAIDEIAPDEGDDNPDSNED